MMQMCENITVADILMDDTSHIVENEDSVWLLILFDPVGQLHHLDISHTWQIMQSKTSRSQYY